MKKEGWPSQWIPLSDLITRDIGLAPPVSVDRVTEQPRRDTIIRPIVFDNAVERRNAREPVFDDLARIRRLETRGPLKNSFVRVARSSPSNLGSLLPEKFDWTS